MRALTTAVGLGKTYDGVLVTRRMPSMPKNTQTAIARTVPISTAFFAPRTDVNPLKSTGP